MGEISDALARARENTDAERDEAVAKQAAEVAARKPSRAPSPTPTPTRAPSTSAAGLMTARPAENAERERSTPLSLDQLREDQLRREQPQRASHDHAARGETTRPALSDPTDFAASETPARQRKVHPIPRLPDDGWISRLCAVYPESPAAVRFRHLAVRVRAMLDELPLKSLLVTSAVAGEGKTTVTVNTALALASIAPECRIALVDLDLRRGRIGGVFEYETEFGIESVLSGAIELEDACVETDNPALDIYPLGRTIPDAHRLLGGSAARVLRELHARYDYVVCDGPPVLPVPDVPLLAPQLGGCLAVVASGRSKHAQFRELLELVPRKSMLGVFLNESPSATGDGKYKYYDPILPEEAEQDKSSRSDKASARAEEKAAGRADKKNRKKGAKQS